MAVFIFGRTYVSKETLREGVKAGIKDAIADITGPKVVYENKEVLAKKQTGWQTIMLNRPQFGISLVPDEIKTKVIPRFEVFKYTYERAVISRFNLNGVLIEKRLGEWYPIGKPVKI